MLIPVSVSCTHWLLIVWSMDQETRYLSLVQNWTWPISWFKHLMFQSARDAISARRKHLRWSFIEKRHKDQLSGPEIPSQHPLIVNLLCICLFAQTLDFCHTTRHWNETDIISFPPELYAIKTQSVKGGSTGPHVKRSLPQQQKATWRGRLQQNFSHPTIFLKEIFNI